MKNPFNINDVEIGRAQCSVTGVLVAEAQSPKGNIIINMISGKNTYAVLFIDHIQCWSSPDFLYSLHKKIINRLTSQEIKLFYCLNGKPHFGNREIY